MLVVKITSLPLNQLLIVNYGNKVKKSEFRNYYALSAAVILPKKYWVLSPKKTPTNVRNSRNNLSAFYTTWNQLLSSTFAYNLARGI